LTQTEFKNVIAPFIPKEALDYVSELWIKYPINIIITGERKTKQGDFRAGTHRTSQITVNRTLNKYAFLITLIHEMAHYLVWLKYKNKVQAHGKEWKTEFKSIMLPLLNPQVFPEDILMVLAKHMINPKASSTSDTNLVTALRAYDPHTDKVMLSSLSLGANFQFNNRTFTLGNKRRTRYECIEHQSQRKYLINQNAEVLAMIASI
jgi:hypothetical protein